MIGQEYFTQKRVSLIIVAIILIVGSAVYFTIGAATKTTMGNAETSTSADLSFLKDVQLKAGYTEEGTIDIFALAKNNALAKQTTILGNPIPEFGGLVLGNVEGSMMQEEGEFRTIGDTVEDYGQTFRIDGVLAKTNTFADDFHFVTSDQFGKLDAESTVLFVKFKDENTPKLFYLYDVDNPSPAKIELAEGNMNLFYKHIVGKKVYYPLIIGAKEAEMMREEKLFTKTGDVIEGFFDKDVMIVGIIKESETTYDMMHIVEKDFFDAPLKPVAGTLA